jgi:hypothetical protein
MRNIKLFLVVGLLSSCLFRKDGYEKIDFVEKSNLQISVNLVDTVRFKVDSISSVSHYYDQVLRIEERIFYLNYNENNHGLYFYDLESRRLSHVYFFEKDGPNGIGNPERFYYHNNDSIFFIEYGNVKKLVMANSLGRVINYWKIEFPDDMNGYWINGELFYEFKFFPSTSEIGFWISKGNVDSKKFQSTIKHGRFNLKNKECVFFGDLPNEFKSANYYPNNYFNGYSVDSRFFSYFLPSHEVHVYNEFGHLERKVTIKSAYCPDVIPTFLNSGTDNDIQEEYNYNYTNPFYVKMFSNEGGTFHFRIVKHPMDKLAKDGKMNNFYNRDFSIMILDEELRIIEEMKFEGGVYDFFQSFSFGNQLFLSLNNPLNSLYSDEYIQFAVFDIK